MNNFLAKNKVSRANWKNILIVVILIFLVSGGVLYLQYSQIREALIIKTEELANKTKEIESLKRRIEDLLKEIDLLKKTEEFKVEEPKVEVANWKIYQNQKYGFEFKYPREYDNYEACKIREIKIENEDWITIGEPPLARFIIRITDSKGLHPLEYAAKEIAEYEITPDWVGGWGIEYPLWVDKEIGVKVWHHFGVRYSGHIFLSRGDKIYEIVFHSGMSCLEYAGLGTEAYTIPFELDIFNQIPFTFRFLR